MQKLKTAFPEDPRGSYLEVAVFRDKGRVTEALVVFEALMKRGPQDASLVYEYASLLERAGARRAERTLRDVLAKIRRMPTR